MTVVDTTSLQWLKLRLYHASSGIEPSSGREIIPETCGSKKSQRISEKSRRFLPLHFTLIYHQGEGGWYSQIHLAEGR